MITCGPTILRACNVVPRVQEALGSRYVGVYAGVAPHAPVETVEEGVAMAKEVQPDVFISVGGGSTHDTTKAIATLLAEGGDIHDYAILFEPPDRITVPPTPVAQAADPQRAHHHGLRRVQSRRRGDHRSPPGSQAQLGR